MNNYVITESGMDFIADTTDTYHIEKSAAYSTVGNGVKSVEFVRKVDDRLWFVEAKSVFPDASDKSRRGNWVQAVCEKFLHSLNLYCTVKLGVTSDVLPTKFTNSSVLFVLVVKDITAVGGDTSGNMKAIQEVLKAKLLPYLRIWKTNLLVIGYDDAKKYRLVS
jgi:hypothetical protein